MELHYPFLLNVDPSVHVLPSQGMIQSGYFRGLDKLVSTMGGNPLKILEENEIDPLAFDNPDLQIECDAAVDLLEYCSRHLHDPLFGLRLAELQEPDAFGCAMALARAAPTVGEALQALIRFVPVSTSPECELEMVTSREVAEFRWWTDTRFGDVAQLNYQGLMLFLKTLHMLGRRHFRPLYASLNFPVERTSRQPLQDRVGCKVNTRSKANAIAFPVETLALPLPTSNAILFSLLEDYLTAMSAASKSSFVEKVEAYVRGTLSIGQCSVSGCADELAISVRTLQKRLTTLDVKFSDIVQKERIKLAKHILLWSDCSLDEIAFSLGYSEQTSFGRAFKRSTGMTPQTFRLAKLANTREGDMARNGHAGGRHRN